MSSQPDGSPEATLKESGKGLISSFVNYLISRPQVSVGCMIIAAFYLSFLPAEGLHVVFGSRLLKLGLWAFLLGMSAVMAGLLMLAPRFDSSAFRKFGWMIAGFATYAGAHLLIQPPRYDWDQAISMVFLIPLMSVLGFIVSRYKRVALSTLACLFGTYVVVGIIIALTTGIHADPLSNRVRLFPEWLVAGEQPYYQNTSLYCALFAVIAWFWIPLVVKSRWFPIPAIAAGAFGILLLPELGGRAAFIAVVLAVFGCTVGEIHLRVRGGFASNSWIQCCKMPIIRFVGFFVVLAIPFAFNSSAVIHRVQDAPYVQNRSMIMVANLQDLAADDGSDNQLGVEGDSQKAMSIESEELVEPKKHPSIRIALYSSAMSQWTSDIKSFLIGNGSQAFSVGFEKYSPKWHPHNFILEALAEFGLIGALLLLAPLGLLGFMMTRCLLVGGAACDVDQLIMIAIAGMIMVVSLLTGGIYSLWLLFFVMFMACPVDPAIEAAE